MMRVFQRHAKGNCMTASQIREAAAGRAGAADAARLGLFLRLYERISDGWERRLREAGGIDFEDMLLLAADHAESGRYVSPFTVVLVERVPGHLQGARTPPEGRVGGRRRPPLRGRR